MTTHQMKRMKDTHTHTQTYGKTNQDLNTRTFYFGTTSAKQFGMNVRFPIAQHTIISVSVHLVTDQMNTWSISVFGAVFESCTLSEAIRDSQKIDSQKRCGGEMCCLNE